MHVIKMSKKFLMKKKKEHLPSHKLERGKMLRSRHGEIHSLGIFVRNLVRGLLC